MHGQARAALAAACALGWALLAAVGLPVAAQPQPNAAEAPAVPPGPPLAAPQPPAEDVHEAVPTLAELEAAGATIGDIRVFSEDIFDLADPKENNWLFRTANRLHIQTRPYVIKGALLFKSGEKLSTRLIDETERLLRNNRYLYDVRIRAVAYRDGVADLEVLTRDTWSLDPGLSVGRSGGANSSGFTLREYNLLGTGASLSLGRSNTVDRSSNEFQLQYSRAFDGWTSLSYSLSDNSDGKRHAAAVLRPFYALDARWAAGVSASNEDRIDSVYTAGVITSQYRHRQDLAEAFGGWSDGLVNGWTQRYSIGVTAKDDAFQTDAVLPPPVRLPSDQKTVAPFFRYEVIEDDFEKLRNRNQIARPEFFALGFAGTVQVGRALRSLGSSQDLWLFSGSVSNGFAPVPQHDLLVSAALSGQYGDGHVQRQLLSGTARYYLPVNPRLLLYASAAGDVLKNPDPADLLTLGGDNGLRGYPLRYQSGERRALFTLEARAYSDLYLLQLFRFGGAAFYDVGRAWGGSNVNPTNPGWLGNIGVGLRIFSVRAAFGNVLHLDLAVPTQRDANIKAVQFLLKTKTSF